MPSCPQKGQPCLTREAMPPAVPAPWDEGLGVLREATKVGTIWNVVAKPRVSIRQVDRTEGDRWAEPPRSRSRGLVGTFLPLQKGVDRGAFSEGERPGEQGPESGDTCMATRDRARPPCPLLPVPPLPAGCWGKQASGGLGDLSSSWNVLESSCSHLATLLQCWGQPCNALR